MITLMCSSGSVVSHHPLFIVYFTHQFCVEAHDPLYTTVIPAGSTYQRCDSNASGSGSHSMTGSQHNGGTAMGSCTTCGSVTGFQGRKPRPCGLATDRSKFWEPAHVHTKKIENAASIARGLGCLECLGRLSWMPVGKLGDLGDRLSDNTRSEERR